MSYQGYEGWFKQHTTALSTGKYWLSEEYPVELGEPVSWHTSTGYVANPINKRRIKSYDALAGAEEALGVSLDIRYAISGVSDEDKVLRPERYIPREITVMHIGICPIKNTRTGLGINLNDTVIPTNGGCESISHTATGLWDSAYTLGKALENIQLNGRGLIWVNPQSFDVFGH